MSSCALNDPNSEPFEGRASQVFMLLLQALLLKFKELEDPKQYPQDYSEDFRDGNFPVTFDFIIIGGGTAGTILANRLSENPKWNVLLVEAGLYPSKMSEVPLLYPGLKGTREDWNFTSEFNKTTCQSTTSNRCNMFQGKVLGGTTTVSPNFYGRALELDWEEWSIFNNTWRHDTMMTIFRRLENMDYEDEPIDCSCADFETTGALPLKPYNDETNLEKFILEVSQRQSSGKMLSNKTFLGYLDVPVISTGRRTNFAKIFLSPIKDRKNLYLSLNTTVEKVLFTQQPDNKATSVVLHIKNQSQEVHAKREVILTAGAINTAKILLASGIGPTKTLDKIGIDPIKNLSVGENLHSHYIVPVFVSFDFDEQSYNYSDYAEAVYDYLFENSGLLMDIKEQNYIGYIATNKRANHPTIAVHHDFIGKNNTFLVNLHNYTWQYNGQIIYSLKKKLKKHSLLVFSLELVKPLSRGVVELSSTDYKNPPVIKHNFLSNNSDLVELVKGYKFVLTILKSPRMKKSNATIVKLNMPACRCSKFDTDEYIECYVRNMGYASTSIVGTAKIGSALDNSTVVNEDLVVHGFRCFRVVDGSVIPTITTQSITGTIAAIAERASELIKEKWTTGKEN